MKKRLNSKGFTLIETIFSIAILGIIHLALSTMLTTTINAYKESKQQYNATLLAQSYFEKIKASPIENVGQTINESEDLRGIIDITEVSKYTGRLYKITIEVTKEEESLEKIEGYKLIYAQESHSEDST